MEQEKRIQLLLRQLRDIQDQADKILSGEKSSEMIENFARYSSELKAYIEKNIDDIRIKLMAANIPNVNYTRTKVQIWHYLIFPTWWIMLYIDYIARNKTVKEIIDVRGKYANLEYAIKY